MRPTVATCLDELSCKRVLSKKDQQGSAPNPSIAAGCSVFIISSIPKVGCIVASCVFKSPQAKESSGL